MTPAQDRGMSIRRYPQRRRHDVTRTAPVLAPTAEPTLPMPDRLHSARGRRMRSLLFVAATGAVSWVWSEVGFWARFRPGDTPIGWIGTWLLYTAVAYLVLRAARRWPVRSLASLILLGALYGWLVEGAAAATLYEALPLSVVWTSTAWHALLTVMAGWYALPRALERGGAGALGWSALTGLAWGLWAVGWWGAPPDDGTPAATPHPASFAVFAILLSAIAAVGYGIQHATSPTGADLTGRAGPWLIGGLLAAWAIPVVVIPIPWAPIVLAAVLALAVTSLRRLTGRGGTCADSTSRNSRLGWHAAGPVEELPLGWRPGVRWSRLAPMAALPATAIVTYVALQPAAGARPGTGPLYIGFVSYVAALSLAGAAALGWSLRQAWRRRSKPPAATSDTPTE